MKFLLPAVITLSMISCSSHESLKKVDPSKPHISIEFAFNTESYHSFIKKFYPQIAIWLKSDTAPSRTVYVTSKGAKNDWFGADQRPSALPVWRNFQNNQPESKTDSISGATPSGSTYRIAWNLPENTSSKKPLNIFIEANISFDYNKFFPKDAPENAKNFTGVNGQPSLIWRGLLDPSRGITDVRPEIIGRGSLLGKDGKIHKDLTGITTAKKIFNYIKIRYHEGTVK